MKKNLKLGNLVELKNGCMVTVLELDKTKFLGRGYGKDGKFWTEEFYYFELMLYKGNYKIFIV